MGGGLLERFRRRLKIDLKMSFLLFSLCSAILGILNSVFDWRIFEGFIALAGSSLVAYAAVYNNETSIAKNEAKESKERIEKFNQLSASIKSTHDSLLECLSLIKLRMKGNESYEFRSITAYYSLRLIQLPTLDNINLADFFSLLGSNNDSYKSFSEDKANGSAKKLWDLNTILRRYSELVRCFDRLKARGDILIKHVEWGEKNDRHASPYIPIASFENAMEVVQYTADFESFITRLKTVLPSITHILVNMPHAVSEIAKSEYNLEGKVALSTLTSESIDKVKELVELIPNIPNVEKQLDQVQYLDKIHLFEQV